MSNNILSQIPEILTDELQEPLLNQSTFRMERIVSRAHATPKGEWYDQENNEWVLLIKGSAGLLFEGSNEPLTLIAGDYLLIPAHVRHRVEWTDEGEDTVWLALHYSPSEDNQVE
jgi:cupin 2 domain-containing protein